jgi:transposase
MKAKDHEQLRERILKCFAAEGTIKKTAHKLHVGINTVRKVLRGQPLGRAAPANLGPRASKLDPYRAVIQRLVLEDHLTGVLVLEEIRQLGFDGGRSILDDYIRQIGPDKDREPTTEVEHVPGKEGQVDWSPYRVELGGEQTVVHAFSLVLPWSRYMVLDFALDEQLETLLSLHDMAFEDIKAIPHVMTYDNMTTVGRHVGPGEVSINPRFEVYMKDRGFSVKLIAPGKPNQHASVERPFHYVENNCLRRRRFRFDSLDDLRQHGRWWCDNVANVRKHGTTGERPIDRLQRERPLMLPLPSARAEPYETITRTVPRDWCVRVANSRYSVPPRRQYIRRPCKVHLYAERLEILIDGEVVAVHARHAEAGRHVLPEHEEEFKRSTPSRRLLEQALIRLGNTARDYHQGLVAERGAGAGYHIQRILRMADRYGSSVVSGAMAQAARYGNYSADAVARVIAGRPTQGRGRHAARDGLVLPPESVRRWLEGLDVEQRDLGDFDRVLQGETINDEQDHGNEEPGQGTPSDDSR